MNQSYAPSSDSREFSTSNNNTLQLSRRWLAIALLFALAPAQVNAADLLITFSNQTQTTSGGSFEVDLTNTSTTQSYGVAGLSLELTVDPSTGVQFTDASTSTIASPYIFDGTGTESIDPTFDFVSPASTPTDLIAGDTEWTYLNIAADPLSTFGLALVSYSLDPGSVFDFTTIQLGPATNVSDETGDTIPLANNSGSVPEPSSLLMLALSSLGLTSLKWHSRGRTVATANR